jgi:NADH-quinone oxidoreductase subunit J
VMLTSQERFVNMKTRSGDWVMAFLAGGALLFVLIYAAFSVHGPDGDPDWSGITRAEAEAIPVAKTATPLGMGLVGIRVDRLDPSVVVKSKGDKGMSGYLLPFEIVSVHLLVVLVGAAYLARAKRKSPARAE